MDSAQPRDDGDTSSSSADGPVSWKDANLPRDRVAELIALAEGLTAIGVLRTGRASGQFSIHNFLLRAAYEQPDADAVDRGPLVVLMRSGVMRRHTWFVRVHSDADADPRRLELPGPIDADWDWWPSIEEIRDRLVQQPAWREAVKEAYGVRAQAIWAALDTADLVRLPKP